MSVARSGREPAVMIVDSVSSIREQPLQMKTCATVVGLASAERDQCISILHFGQIGVSSCSNARLSLSTMRLAVSCGGLR